MVYQQERVPLRVEAASKWLQLIDPRGQLHRRALVASLIIIAILIAAHLCATLIGATRAAATQDGTIALFDLDDELTLAVWFSSGLFILVAIAAMTLAWFRDYGASWERLGWRGVTLVMLFFSLDETSGIHETFGGTLARLFPHVPISPSSWWTLPYVLLVGTAFFFIACAAQWQPNLLMPLFFAGICWLGAVIFEHLHLFSLHINVAMEEGLEMLGTALLLYSLLALLQHHRKSCYPPSSPA